MDVIRRWRWVDVKGRRMFGRVSDYVGRRSVEIQLGITGSRTSTPFSRKPAIFRLPMTGKEARDWGWIKRDLRMAKGGVNFPRISRTRVSVSDFVKAFSRDITGNCGRYLSLVARVVQLRHEMHEFCGEFDSLYTWSVRGCGPWSVAPHQFVQMA